MTGRESWLLGACLCSCVMSSAACQGLQARDLALIVNTADRLSVGIAEYYQRRRQIPAENVIRVTFDAQQISLSESAFLALKARVDRSLPAHVQALALTWVTPYRVECMSITTAFAAGFDRAYCATGCATTRRSPYFNADSHRPYQDFGLRPAMSIAATSLTDARDLIERGVASDGTQPAGTAYLVETEDAARNVRSASYANAELLVKQRVAVARVREPLRHRTDVMFYFIGARRVADIDSNRFLPGAIADHLTSTGGVLVGGAQMSSLRWLEAGATGSYGTVVEPCNLLAKFPNPAVLMHRYTLGDTLLEAYWKSVAMPGQGLFIGEPLARPFADSH